MVKPIPVRPALAPGEIDGGVLPPKPAHRADSLTAADGFQWFITMDVSPNILWPTQYATVTVTANADVGPTPYFLRIWYFDGQNGVYLASCGIGTTCSGSVTRPDVGSFEFWGIIEDSNHVNQALGIASADWDGAGTALSTSAPTTGVGASVTLTATTREDIGPSPFYIVIFDATTGTLLNVCGSGTSCSAQVSQSEATTHAYQAFLSPPGVSYPPPGAVDTTPVSYVTWETSAWSVNLTADARPQQTATVTATASADVGPTPYFIEIFDENGTLIGLCGAGTTCTVQYRPSESGSNLVAFVAPWSTTLVPTGAVANSATVTSTLFPPPK